MHGHDRNVDFERVRMSHWTVWSIKINTLNMRIIIYKVAFNKFPCIWTVTLFNNRINEWTEEIFSFREGFDWGGIWKKRIKFLFLSYFTNKDYFRNYLWGTFKPSPMFFGVEGFIGRKTSIYETIGLNWSNMEWISSRYVLWYLFLLHKLILTLNSPQVFL